MVIKCKMMYLHLKRISDGYEKVYYDAAVFGIEYSRL